MSLTGENQVPGSMSFLLFKRLAHVGVSMEANVWGGEERTKWKNSWQLSSYSCEIRTTRPIPSLPVCWLVGSSVFQCFCMDCVILVLRSHQNFPGPSSGQDGKPPRLSRVSLLRLQVTGLFGTVALPIGSVNREEKIIFAPSVSISAWHSKCNRLR